MDYKAPQSVSEDLRELLESRARQDGPRVERIDVDNHVFWIKRVEQLDLRYRLQKGDPRKAFERERLAYHEMNAAMAPVPKLVAEGHDFLVLPDCGLDLRKLLERQEDTTKRDQMLLDASVMLANFHKLGFAHGRPSPKDMCQVDGQMLLLDFERYKHQNNTPVGQARDLVVFAFNVAAHSPEMRGVLPDAMAAYRAVADQAIWPLAQRWCRWFRWADWATKPLQRRPKGRSREFKAIPVVLDLFLSD
ncbi:hypothetical protein [Shimia sagamensis]|uniref:tRNA A-37 threonylcarbamoyl transferase component Bud32 n=1 Tax=Shimia sagamensis TaxID=1566352 RepID=A0ABY1NAZ7_9RHOB|nr:hypothetical protein [Shimia sagamensis]SMP04769.1 tRNA A-37 threonylcarbamoyl transferase component Bud32 [Shimia sagamensis]